MTEHRNKKIKEGEQVLFVCGCIAGGTPYVIEVIKSDHPVITKLHCPECGTKYDVTDGRINI